MCIKNVIKKIFMNDKNKSIVETTEYIYLWLNNYQSLNDFGGEKYLIENQGFSLNPKFNVNHEYDKKKKTIKIDIKENRDYVGSIYDELDNIKAFVGKNGGAKTTILRRLFKIIGYGFGKEGEDVYDYVLVYKKGRRFYYHQSKCLKEKEIKIICDKEIDESDNYKSDLAIFYTGAVDDRINSKWDSADRCYDISANGLMPIDYEAIHNKTVDINKTDYFSAYVIMDMIRKITFACRFYDVFFRNSGNYFRFPNAISIVPSEIDIDNSIVEISKGSKEIEKKWLTIKKAQNNFRDKFCFAALLNHLKAFNSNRDKILEDCYNPAFYENKQIKDVIHEYSIYNSTLLPIEEQEFARNILDALDLLMLDNPTEYEKKYCARIIDLDDKKQREKLNNFVYIYQKLMLNTPFILMQWRPQSSGEENFIKIFSRLYYAICEEKKHSLKNPSSITLFIDEADLYMHPQWQCHWLWEFKSIIREMLNEVYGTNHPILQVFISTHSPFIITDLQEENILLIKREEGKTSSFVDKETRINPFGSNVYELLKTGFFLDDYIGVLSKNVIENAVENLISSDEDKKRLGKSIISKIGDRVLKSLIQEMDDEK